MNTELRPRRLGEILDATAQLYRSHFWLFAGIAAFPAGVPLVVGLVAIGVGRYFTRIGAYPATAVGLAVAGAMLGGLLYVVLLGVALAATSCAVSQIYFDKPSGIAAAYGEVRPHWLRYLLIMIVTVIYAWAPTFLFLAAAAGVAAFLTPKQGGSALAAGAMFLLIMAMLAGLVLGVWMTLRYSFSVPASIFEGRRILASLKRSVFLTTDSRGRIFVMLLLVAVISSVLSFAVQVPFLIVGSLVGRSATTVALISLVASQVMSYLINSLLSPVYGIAITLFYYDERIRKEGFDLEWMMQRANLVIPAQPPIAPGPLGAAIP